MQSSLETEQQPEESSSGNVTCQDPQGGRQGEKHVSCRPNGGYGWVNTVCILLINAHTWGINSSYGVFLNHYLSNNIYPDASNLDFAFVGGLSISVALFVCPLGTIVTRKYGTHTTMLLGAAMQAVSLIAASFAKATYQLFLSQGVCFGVGMGFLFVASVGIIPQWFTTRRSLANGIGAAGSGLGGLAYSLGANAMISSIGLAWAYRVIGIIAFVVNTSCTLLIKDRHRAIGSTHIALDYRLFRRPEYVMLLLFGILTMLGYVALLFSLPNYAASIGLTAHQGSVVGAVFNLGQALGRPPIGYFSDAMGRLNMSSSMTFAAGLLSLAAWIPADGYGSLVFFALVGGAVAGTYWATIAPVTTEVVGIVNLQSALSLNWIMLSLPTTFSEAIALRIVDINHRHYRGAQLFAGFMYIGAAVSLWLVRVWKIGDAEGMAAVAKQREQARVSQFTNGKQATEAEEIAGTNFTSYGRRMVMWCKV